VRPAAADADRQPIHCLACHLARSFRPRTEGRIVTAPASQTGTRVHLRVVTASHAAPVAQPPLRSPPASPASV
jgi:hypothetical protein